MTGTEQIDLSYRNADGYLIEIGTRRPWPLTRWQTIKRAASGVRQVGQQE